MAPSISKKVPAHASHNVGGGKRVMESNWNQSSVQAAKETITDEELKRLLPEKAERKFPAIYLGIPYVLWLKFCLTISTSPLDVAREMLWIHMYELNFKENEEENEGWVDVEVTEAAKISEDKSTEELRQKLKQDFIKFLRCAMGTEKAEAVIQKLNNKW